MDNNAMIPTADIEAFEEVRYVIQVSGGLSPAVMQQ